ncbi:MAG: hypothetical protein LW809_05340 [Vampirovibrionales bacterium]|nr:hypothetical protein [Vampirovibrionales bacterium]
MMKLSPLSMTPPTQQRSGNARAAAEAVAKMRQHNTTPVTTIVEQAVINTLPKLTGSRIVNEARPVAKNTPKFSTPLLRDRLQFEA